MASNGGPKRESLEGLIRTFRKGKRAVIGSGEPKPPRLGVLG